MEKTAENEKTIKTADSDRGICCSDVCDADYGGGDIPVPLPEPFFVRRRNGVCGHPVGTVSDFRIRRDDGHR